MRLVDDLLKPFVAQVAPQTAVRLGVWFRRRLGQGGAEAPQFGVAGLRPSPQDANAVPVSTP